ncbi:MAG: FG-GAP repeat domain-containing protein [Planctomycetota bacterium]
MIRSFSRLLHSTGSNAKDNKEKRSVVLNCERLEARDVPASVLMTDGALASIPTWGIQPQGDLSLALASFYIPTVVISKDIQNNPIDFNQDGFPDIIESGEVVETVGYGTKTSSLVASDRSPFGKVAFGGPHGLTFSKTGGVALDINRNFVGGYFAVTDLNNDGFQDVLVVNNHNSSGVGAISRRYIWDPAQLSFTSEVGAAFGAWQVRYGQLVLGDVNGDQIPDLVTQNYDTVSVLLPGTADSVYPLIGFQVWLGKVDANAGRWIGDFEANPYATVALAAPSTIWSAHIRSDGKLSSSESLTPVIQPVLADLNGDGKLDLAIPEMNGITTFINPGNGQFSNATGAQFFSTAGSANGLNLVAGDFNNDGKTDLATSPNLVSGQLMGYASPSVLLWEASQAPVSVLMETATSTSPLEAVTTNPGCLELSKGMARGDLAPRGCFTAMATTRMDTITILSAPLITSPLPTSTTTAKSTLSPRPRISAPVAAQVSNIIETLPWASRGFRSTRLSPPRRLTSPRFPMPPWACPTACNFR